jgi:hypothetical protein
VKVIALLILGLTPILLAASCLWNGYVLSVIWGWFIVPTFGLHALGVVPAIGVCLVMSFLTHQYSPPCKEEKTGFSQLMHSIGYIAARPLLTLLAGWIVLHWMPA